MVIIITASSSCKDQQPKFSILTYILSLWSTHDNMWSLSDGKKEREKLPVYTDGNDDEKDAGINS